MTPLAYCLIGLAFVLGLGVALFLARHTKAQMSDHFKSLASDVLQNNSKTCVRIAKGELQTIQESAKGELARRREGDQDLVEPLKQQLEAYQKELQQSETAQSQRSAKEKSDWNWSATQSVTGRRDAAVPNGAEMRIRRGRVARKILKARRRSGEHDFALMFLPSRHSRRTKSLIRSGTCRASVQNR